MDKRCAMLNRADVVRITPDMRPAFFWVGGRTGTDRQELVRRCRAEEEAALKARPDVGGPDPASCDHAAGAYGPFTRKPVWDGFDDARSFVYLDEHGWWLSEEGQPICFPAGTPVATLDGDRPIETLAAGDLVLSWSMDRGAPVEARVIHVKRRQARELLELTLDDGRALRVSANHPLYVPARADWVPAGDLRAGDRLAMLADGRLVPVAIAVIAARHIDVDVFDLTIETTHAYFAGGVLAHNY
jgi:hypothetical protein